MLSTPVPYPNNFGADTPPYQCPRGTVVTQIEATVNTEARFDELVVFDYAEQREVETRSGALGNITIPMAHRNSSWIGIVFRSDGSIVPPNGVARVLSITCGLPQTQPTPPNATGAENCCDGVDVTQAE